MTNIKNLLDTKNSKQFEEYMTKKGFETKLRKEKVFTYKVSDSKFNNKNNKKKENVN